MFNIKRRYRLHHYLLGALPARLGDEMSGQAILLMATAITQTAALGSMILAALTFSAAIGGPLLGAVLDRAQYPGRILAGAIGCYAVGMLLIATMLGNAPVWVSIAIALVSGLLMPAISGGWSSRLKSFVAEEQMTRASAIDATTFNVAGLIGPGIAGLVAAAFGAHWSVILLVILLTLALPMAWVLPKRALKHTGDLGNSFIHDFTDGFKIIFHNKKLFRITVVSAISYLGIGMLWVLYPLLGDRLLGNPGFGGMLASVLSVAALIATLAYAKWPTKYSPDRIVFVTTLVLAGAMLLLVCTDNLALALCAMAIVGLADGPQLAAVFAVRHREAPARSRSQVFTTGASVKITAAAAGALVAGQLADGSLGVAIVVACASQLFAANVYALLTLMLRKASTQ